MPLTFICGKIPTPELAFTNNGFVSIEDYTSLKNEAQRAGVSVTDNKEVSIIVQNSLRMMVKGHAEIPRGTLAVNGNQRKTGRLMLSEEILVDIVKESIPYIESATFLIRPIGNTSGAMKDTELTTILNTTFANHVFIPGQRFNAKANAVQMEIIIDTDTFKGREGKRIGAGTLSSDTDIDFVCDAQSGLKIKQTKFRGEALFDATFNFENLGIGGLDTEFQDIYRRAFASRVYPPAVLEELGMTHIKGMILHGPPGTGKTLIARQIGKALKAEEPKVVNGPEILNKYVGQSEENIRNLFKDAEEEQKVKGDQSKLHIIIFDELDAICKQRGSTPGSTGVNDSIVNQLLSKIDGVDALNNILIIGMTNRLDMIDEALLRPGRFECLVEIGLCDAAGREQILNIHTKNMREAGRLASDVNLHELSLLTKNFSGAELAGLCRSAGSFALSRHTDYNDISKGGNIDSMQINNADFALALDEVHAGFGADEEALELRFRNGIIPFSSEFLKVKESVEAVIKQQRDHDRTPIFSLLLHGIHGSGKTALACQLASVSNYPFIKLISPDDDRLVGASELGKISFINKVFNDAYKSSLSLIVIDDIERLIEYTRVGPRFSNAVLQNLINLIRKAPKKEGRRVLVIATTSEDDFLTQVGMKYAFQASYQVPAIKTANQLKRVLTYGSDKTAAESEIDRIVQEVEKTCQKTHKILGVKQVNSALEMASAAGDGVITHRAFMSALKDVGFGANGA